MAKKSRKTKKKTSKKPKRVKAKKKTAKKKPVRRAKSKTKAKKTPSVEHYFEKEVKKVERKFEHKPIVGAILNFFLWGAGFIYIGRVIYGLAWLFASALIVLPTVRMQKFLPTDIATYLSAGYLIISVLLALDAYFQAKEILHWHD